MDKKELFEKSEKAINQAFEVVKSSLKVLSEKAGEAAHVTRLLIEKATLEHKISKLFAQLGHKVYEKSVRKSESISLEDSSIKKVIDQTKKIEVELGRVEATLEKERKDKKKKK